MRYVPTLLLLFATPSWAGVSEWLDDLRKYDLNNYSLGVAVSTLQSPYVDTENSTIVYPYLTSFTHPSMTDNPLIIRDGEAGLRYITDSEWEFAFTGRIETQTFGNHDSEALRGVASPKWSIEVGPAVGVRRWPVHLHLAAYFEPTNRHGGANARFAMSYPIKIKRGYIVPALAAIYEDSNYTDYYYAVTAAEATPERPEFSPDSALNVKFRVVWGYALSDRWLLSGKLGYEVLDDSIQQSPLVDRDELWSFNLGLAYNARTFSEVSSDADMEWLSDFDIRLGIFNTTVDTRIGRETADGIPGDEIDLEDLLGESDNENVAQIDIVWRLAQYHRLEASYFELVRTGNITLPEPAQHGDSVFAEGADIRSRSHFKSIRVGYAYSLMRDSQKELGVMAGVHFSSFESLISSPDDDQTQRSELEAPLPVIGAHGSANLGEKTTVAARLQFFRTDFDNYEGSLNYATIDVQRRFGESFNIGIGYNYYRMKLRSSNEDLNGYVHIEHRGPTLFFGYQF